MLTCVDTAPRLFTLGRAGGLQITVMDFGATWLSCRVPLPDGTSREALLGHASPAAYASQPGYLGAVVGRCANRIAHARFSLGGRVYQLQANEGQHQLHGGPEGFNRRRWRLLNRGPLHLRLALHSPAGDQGYPGAVDAEVSYRLHKHTVTIGFEATASEPGPVNLTNHAYFNLDAQPGPVLRHRLRVNATQMLPVDAQMIPTGELAPVAGTPFDLRTARRIGQAAPAGGYDHCFVLDAPAACGEAPAAELTSADGRLALQLHTNYPGLQVYGGNHLAQARGRDGQAFVRHAGLALEPQFFPDSPNQPAWRDMGCLLQPGQRLQRWMRVSFSSPSR